jgi:hypothetical protein
MPCGPDGIECAKITDEAAVPEEQGISSHVRGHPGYWLKAQCHALALPIYELKLSHNHYLVTLNNCFSDQL